MTTRIDGPVEEGSSVRWKAGPGTITSRVEHVERPHFVVWSARTLGNPSGARLAARAS